MTDTLVTLLALSRNVQIIIYTLIYQRGHPHTIYIRQFSHYITQIPVANDLETSSKPVPSLSYSHIRTVRPHTLYSFRHRHTLYTTHSLHFTILSVHK